MDQEEMHRVNTQKFDNLSKRITDVENATAAIKADTNEIVEFFRDAKDSARWVILAGRYGKSIAAFVAGASIIYTTYLAFKAWVLSELHH